MASSASSSEVTNIPIAIIVEPAAAASRTDRLSSNTRVLDDLLASGQITREDYAKLKALEPQALEKALNTITSQPSVTTKSNSPTSTISFVVPDQKMSMDNTFDAIPDQTDPNRNAPNAMPDQAWWDRDDISEQVNQNSKLRKHTSKGLFRHFRYVKGLPLLLQTLVLILGGGVLVMIPGTVSVVFFVKDRGAYWIQQEPTQMGIGGYPVFVVAVYITIVWTFFWGCRYFLIILPELVIRVSDFIVGTADDGSTNIMIEHLVDYIRHIRRPVVYLLTSVVGWTSFAGIFNQHVDDSIYYNWQKVITLIWSCLVWACFTWVGEKLALQVFAVQFSRRAFAERLADEKFAFHVLGYLNRARYRPHNSLGMSNPMMSKSDLSQDSQHGSDLDTEMLVNELEKAQRKEDNCQTESWFKGGGFSNFHIGLGESTKKFGLYAKNVGGLLVGYEANESAGVVLRSLHDAKLLAKRLFMALQRGSSGVIYPNDFKPYFSSDQETMDAFRLFDKNDNGDISPQEMRSTIINIYRDKLALDKSLRDGNQAMQKLDGMLKVLMLVLIVFISLAFFGVNVTQFLAGLISLWLGILFAVGGTVKNLLEAIIFLFITHPYDVGDVVEVDGVTYIVKEFGLTSTIFRTGDGKETIAPNPILTTKIIYNIRRSGPMVETITLKVSSDTTEGQLTGLKERLNSFLNTQTRDFNSGVTPVISGLTNDEMTVSISPQHKMNWSQGSKVTRSNKLMIELRKIIRDLDIKMSRSCLNVSLDPATAKDAVVGATEGATLNRRVVPDYKDE